MEGGAKIGESEAVVGGLPPNPPNPLATVAGSQPFRFVFVDGLRGLAALTIVVFHIWCYEPAPYPAFEDSHWIVNLAFRRMRVAVQVLLVISGFVVAYTLRKTWVSPREIFWFLGRRIVRLIPPYWVTIGVIILVDILCQRIWNLTSPFDGPLSLRRVSAHLTLMQDVLGHEALSAGIWTICIEMQFYVVAVLAWGVAQRIAPRPVTNEPRPSVWGLLAVFVPAAFASLFYWRPDEATSPYVIHFLWMFFLGMVTWWTLDRTVPTFIFVAIIAVGVVELRFSFEELRFQNEWWIYNTVALTTAVAIFAAGRLNRMQVWLNWRWLQYLGRISYSPYLIHFPVCHLIMSAGWKWFNETPSPVQADAILLASLLASILAAHFVYMFVETPANRWAANLKRIAETPASKEPTPHHLASGGAGEINSIGISSGTDTKTA